MYDFDDSSFPTKFGLLSLGITSKYIQIFPKCPKLYPKFWLSSLNKILIA